MNGVRFVNPQKQYQDLKPEILATVDDVFSRGDLIMRQDLEDFEKTIADYVGVKYALGVNSGTDALSMMMEAAGVGPGDEVITVGHTFMATISAAYHVGATATLIDVAKDFNMDPRQIEKAITPRTKVIEPVHLNGRVCDMNAIMEIANKHNLLVIEDAAQALGAKIKMNDGTWKMAGSFGVGGAFSMYPFKVLGAFGDAGVMTTNDAEMYRKVKLLRYNGESREDRKFYYHGYTAPLDNLQAALLSLKFKHFPKWIERRRELAELYHAGLRGIPELEIPEYKDGDVHYDIFQNYVIRTPRRAELLKVFKEKNIETLVSWDTPMYHQPVLMPNTISLPETEAICREVVSLPLYPELTNEDVAYVVAAIREFFHV